LRFATARRQIVNEYETDKRMTVAPRADRPSQRVSTDLDDITYKVIGCAMSVHNALGPRLKESTYHHALHVEMANAGLTCEEEVPVEIHLGEASVGLLYLDHLVDGRLIVEDKALSHLLTAEEFAQIITYLAATGHPEGLLLNFGRGRLEYKRIFRPANRSQWRERIQRYIWKPRHP
jgi:GxxExxY protein